jgi:peroxiredoxin
MSTRRAPKLATGDHVPSHCLTSMTGAPVTVPDAGQLVHLQLRRFAGCPICNLHLRCVSARSDEIAKAGIHEVIVFHSSAQDLRKHEAQLPFDVIPDPDKKLYREFGAESSLRSVGHPKAWFTVAHAFTRSLWATLRRRAPMAPLIPPGGSLGLPADLLIAPGGRVVAAKYGTHASDQWPVDELLELSRTELARRP